VTALRSAHVSGWAHLDVNPSNIMQDDQNRYVLIDFGLAKPIDPSRVFPRCGTAGYIAPEVFDSRARDARADVWSAGVVFAGLVAHYIPEASDRLSGLGSRYSSREVMREACEVFAGVAYDTTTWLVPECVRRASELACHMLEDDWRKRFTCDQCLEFDLLKEDANIEWVELQGWLQSKRSRRRRDWGFDEDNWY